MVFTRRDVWANGGDFNDPILLWYAKGVGSLKAKAIADPTSWRFLAAIHGFSESRWTRYEYLNDTDILPSQSLQDTYWDQCQHQTWYFLPWHRGYLASFEKIVRDAIVQLDGPTDWAIPYWNYSSSNQPNALTLPPAFSREQMDDGTPNPLFVIQRYGDDTTPIRLPAMDVTLENLEIANFEAPITTLGFGGPETEFSPNGRVNGGLERKPHNLIHTDIGGGNFRNPGLMSVPNTAALDPIFWIHHANIDRLWEVWLQRNPAHQNPTKMNWLDGPMIRKFIVPDVNGQPWQFAPKDMLQTTAPTLDYVYADISDPIPGNINLFTRSIRLRPNLFVSMPNAASEDIERNIELIGANQNQINLIGTSASTQVRLDNRGMERVQNSFRIFANTEALTEEPDNIFLNIENIRSAEDGGIIDVYVNLPEDANSAENPNLFVGSIAFFGVQQASSNDESHGGQGINEVFDITHIMDKMHLSGELNTEKITVNFIPREEVLPEYNISIGRVSIYRQGRR